MAYLTSCLPHCVDDVDITGSSNGPAYMVSAALNVPGSIGGIKLAQDITTTIPFNVIISGSTAGIAAFGNGGIFTVVQSGIYRIDYNIAVLFPISAPLGMNVVISVQQNMSLVSSSIFTLAQNTTPIRDVFSISSYYIGKFVTGDEITITARCPTRPDLILPGPPSFGIPPYPTVVTVTSLF